MFFLFTHIVFPFMGLDDVQFKIGSFLSSDTSRASNKIPILNVCVKKLVLRDTIFNSISLLQNLSFYF